MDTRHDDLEVEVESSFYTWRIGRQHFFRDGKDLVGEFKVEREMGRSQGRMIMDNSLF